MTTESGTGALMRFRRGFIRPVFIVTSVPVVMIKKFAASFSYHVTCVRYDRNLGIDGPQQVLN